MEYNLNEESTNSREEVSKGDEEDSVDLGVGRSYECVYCKRGFNTAQALGGHMNIHRKDRVKKTSNNSKKQEEIYTGPRLYQQLPSYNYQSDNYAPHDHQPILMSYSTYFPGSDSSTRSTMDGNDCNHLRPLNLLIPHDWHAGFSTKEDMEMNESGVILNQKEELDLELRLGYI